MAPTNSAAVLPAAHQKVEIRDAPYPTPAANQIVVKSHALAINPFDYVLSSIPNIVAPFLAIPAVLGSDVAGEVVSIGANVSRFTVGDRVTGLAVAVNENVPKEQQAAEGGFQKYVVLREDVTSHVPSHMSYEDAAVLPLGVSTAACALFGDDQLKLPLPSLSSKDSGKTVLIWGASSSVGCNAVQLARAAGVEVIATASPKNHAMLKELGASQVFGYDAVNDIINAFKGKTAAGAISMGPGGYRKCMDVLARVEGNKFIAQATLDMPALPGSTLGMPRFMAGVGFNMVSGKIAGALKGVTGKFLNGNDLAFNALGKKVWAEYLDEALKQGKYVAAPAPQVVGKGLEKVQEAMDLCQKGVSAKKLVVTLEE